MAYLRVRHFWWFMQILYKSKSFVVINKPAGIPSQSDSSADEDALTLTERELSALGEPDKLYLVHRLDRVVGGLLVFARDSRAADAVSKILSTDGFIKEYLAVTEGEAESGVLTDYLYKDSRLSRAFVVNKGRMGAKYAQLFCEPIQKNEKHTLVKVRLNTGRFHQIRAQLSHRSTPLVGDKKYGSRDSLAHAPALFSHRLAFECMGERIDVCALPDINAYPWCEFQLTEEQK